MSVVSDAWHACFNYTQENEEASSDHTRRFKAAMWILQSHLEGPILVTKVMEETHPENVHMEDNEEGGMELLVGLDQATMIDEQLSSYVYLENADQRNFGSVLKGLKNQKILENDQFPKTIAKARRILSNHVMNKENFGHILHDEVDSIH